MVLYVTLGFIFLAIVIYAIYKLAQQSGGSVTYQAAPNQPKYDWQTVVGRTAETSIGKALDKWLENDEPRSSSQRGSSASDYTESSVGSKVYVAS